MFFFSVEVLLKWLVLRVRRRGCRIVGLSQEKNSVLYSDDCLSSRNGCCVMRAEARLVTSLRRGARCDNKKAFNKLHFSLFLLFFKKLRGRVVLVVFRIPQEQTSGLGVASSFPFAYPHW